MYVCICKQVTESKILEAVEAGHRDVDALGTQLGLGTKCGTCRNFTQELIEQLPLIASDQACP